MQLNTHTRRLKATKVLLKKKNEEKFNQVEVLCYIFKEAKQKSVYLQKKIN